MSSKPAITRNASRREANRLPALLVTIAAGILFSCVACAAGGAQSGLAIEDGWVRAMPPGQPVTAGFMVLFNPGEQPLTVVGISSEQAERVQLHRTVQHGERVRMEAVGELEIPAGGRVLLAPGGLHLMLFGLSEQLGAGESVLLAFTLSDGSRVVSNLPVVDARRRAGEIHRHHH